MTEFDHAEVTLCGRWAVKIRLLTYLYFHLLALEMSVLSTGLSVYDCINYKMKARRKKEKKDGCMVSVHCELLAVNTLHFCVRSFRQQQLTRSSLLMSGSWMRSTFSPRLKLSFSAARICWR